MSLDDIIKLNKKQNQKPGNNNAAKPQGGANSKRNGNQNRNNNQQSNRARSNGNGQRNNQQVVNKKPLGMLNKSKTIQKAQKRPNNQQQNKVQQQRQPMQAQFVGNRRRKPNNNNRANNRPVNTNNQRATNTRPANKATVFNRFGNVKGKGTPQKTAITIIKPAAVQQNNKSPAQRPAQQRGRRNPAGNVATNSKVLMQSARKNVQKAKRVLNASKKPVTQLMTQHFATKIGLASNKFGTARVKPTKPLAQRPLRPLQQPKKKSILNQAKSKLIKVNIKNKASAAVQQRRDKSSLLKQQQVKKVNVQAATKRPILNRARPQGAPGLTSSRMVFL